MTLERTQQLVKEALAGIRNAPPVHTVLSAAELGRDAPDGVMGVTTRDGSVFVVASGHGSDIEVFRTVFHELFHKGLRNVLPQADYVRAMLDLAKRDARLQRYAVEWKKSDAADSQYAALIDEGFSGSELTAQFEALATEEGLARIAEELKADKLVGTGRGATVLRLAQWLANVAERMGMSKLAQAVRAMTYKESERFVMQAISRSGEAPAAEGRMTDAHKADGAAERDGLLRSTGDAPPRSESPGKTPLYEAFRQLARFEGSFQMATSRAQDLGMIAEEMQDGRIVFDGKFTADKGSALHQGR